MSRRSAIKDVRRRMALRHVHARRALLPRMREPSATAYRSDLLDVVCEAQRRILPTVEKLLRQRIDAPGDELKALFARLRIVTSAKTIAPTIAKAFVKDVEKQNRAAMNTQFRRVVKIDPFQSAKGLERVMSRRARENVELIVSLPEQLLDEVERVVVPAITSGIRNETIMERLRERFAISDNRAQLIARDQVGKYNAQLARARQNSLGLTEYVWSTSKDSRVRADHKELEGRIFSYADPPIVDSRTGRVANPGEDFQCRCQALPRVSALLDSLGIADDVDIDAAE